MSSVPQTLKRIFVDTNFLSSLLKENDPLKNEALSWISEIKNNNKRPDFYLSTITIAEFCRFGDREAIPNFFQILPFDDDSAELSSKMANLIFPAKQTLAQYVSLPKNIITNDIKIIAHAETIKPDMFLSADKGLESIHNILKNQKLVSYNFFDFKKTYASFNL